MTTLEFLKLNHQFTAAENKTFKRSNVLCGRKAKDLITLKFKEVEKIKELVAKGDLMQIAVNLLSWVKPITVNEIFETNYTDFVYFIKWIEDQIKNIHRIEKEYLFREVDDELVQAGIEVMEKHGSNNVIDALANGDITKYDEIRNMRYEKVFDKMLLDKDKSDVRENLEVIQARKRKEKQNA